MWHVLAMQRDSAYKLVVDWTCRAHMSVVCFLGTYVFMILERHWNVSIKVVASSALKDTVMGRLLWVYSVQAAS